jgi:hypothetical protein
MVHRQQKIQAKVDFKTAHILKLDNGNFAAQPNNRICWFEPAFIVKPYIDCETKPDYKVNEHLWKCEGQSKWYTEDSDKYFYDILRGKD